jgi:hypothetical protein
MEPDVDAVRGPAHVGRDAQDELVLQAAFSMSTRPEQAAAAPPGIAFIHHIEALNHSSTAKSSADWKMPEIDTPVAMASWSVVVAARFAKPFSGSNPEKICSSLA